MTKNRRGVRRWRRPPETSRELLAYNAGRRMRRAWQPGNDQAVPTPEQVAAGLSSGELFLRSTMSERRWWACWWQGWASSPDDAR